MFEQYTRDILKKPSTLRLGGIVSLLCLLGSPLLRSQELKVQPTPYTAWIDFKKLSSASAPAEALPIWLESVQPSSTTGTDGVVTSTTYRFRFRRLDSINGQLLLRLFFDDEKGLSPTVTAWNEVGSELYQSGTLGQGLGLPTSETLTIPMSGIDYIDIDVSGSGANLRAAFLSSVKDTQTREALDFPSTPALNDPFGNTSTAQPAAGDSYLFGRVKASLDANPIKLAPENSFTATLEFDLDRQPLMAVVTFEVLNADVASPPEITVNDQALGPVSMVLPDLADPAFTGSIYALQTDMHFNYTGWLKCQKIVPGSALLAATNTLTLQAAKNSNPVAIRAVEVQLKYTWQNFDYTLSPLQQ